VADRFSDLIARRAARKLRARGRRGANVWFSLGMIGLVGWSVAVPTLIGVAFGLWLDRNWPTGQVSWTLTMLFAGAALGSFNAWRWVRQEGEPEADDELADPEREGSPGKEGTSGQEGMSSTDGTSRTDGT
jgi:ATP synthase protein I